LVYAAIPLEHPIRIEKSASALLEPVFSGQYMLVSAADHEVIGDQLRDAIDTAAGSSSA